MPINQAIFICTIYLFGGLVSDFLMRLGVVGYPFYVYSPPALEELKYILIQSAVFCMVVFVGRFFIIQHHAINAIPVSKYSAYFSSRIHLFLLLLFFLSIWLTAYYWDRIIADTATRHSGNQIVLRLTLLLVLCMGGVFHNSKFPIKILAFSFLIYIGTISGSIESSRVVALPFIIASFSFLRKRNYFIGTFFLYLSLIALWSAFASRSNPSYFNFWSYFINAIFSFNFIDHVLVIIQYSFPGLTTVQISMNSPGEFSIDNLLRFFLYISPIPSSYLPDNLFEGSSLSDALGIDRSLLGINQDIYSEGIYWFGIGFSWVYTVSLALLVLLPYYIAAKVKSFSSNNIYLACFIANIWMIVGGQVFTLRAGSRAVVALVILMIAFSLIRRVRFRSQGFVGGRL